MEEMLQTGQEFSESHRARAYTELERGVYAALETYSNVHRGSGHNSMVTTHLFEQAREIVLEHLGLDRRRYTVIFCTARRYGLFIAQLGQGTYQCVSSRDTGLPLGIRALAVEKNALHSVTGYQTGGGTAKLVSPRWVIQAGEPDRFEAGTPAIINIIAFARALLLQRHYGHNIFSAAGNGELKADEVLYDDTPGGYSGRELLGKLGELLIGRNVCVPAVEGRVPCINLDNAASTPAFIPVWDAVCRTWRCAGRVRQDIVREVKSICAGFLGAPVSAYDMIFTSNTTEAINIVAESLGNEPGSDFEPVVLNTILEHNSNELPWRSIPGCSLERLDVDAEGFVDLNELENLLRAYNRDGQHGMKRIRLVAVSGASNVLGVFNDMAGISRIVHSYGAQLLVDAAQLAAHRRIAVEEWGIDYLALSGHKMYAPFGTGLLVAGKGLLNFGPGDPDIIRSSGEENVSGIAALGRAVLLLQRIGMEVIRDEEQALTGDLLRSMAGIPGLRIYGIKDPDSDAFKHKGGVVVFDLKGIMSGKVAVKLAEQGGIGVRYGCHCAHMLVKKLLNINPLLERIQGLILVLFPGVMLPGLVRVSLGIQNSKEDVDTFIRVLGRIAGGSGTAGPAVKKVREQMRNFVSEVSMKVYEVPRKGKNLK